MLFLVLFHCFFPNFLLYYHKNLNTYTWRTCIFGYFIGFYGISTPCRLFNAMSCYMCVNEYFVCNILNKPEFICLNIVKWVQVLLCNANNSI